MNIVYVIQTAGAYNASVAFFGTILLLGGALAGLYAFLMAQKRSVGAAWGLWVAQFVATAIGSFMMPTPAVVFANLFVFVVLISVSVVTCCGGGKNKHNDSSCCGGSSCCSGGSSCGGCSGGDSSCCGCDNGGSSCCSSNDCPPPKKHCPPRSVTADDSEFVLQYQNVSYSASDYSRSC